MHIRSAKHSDVPHIAALVKQHALEGKMLPRSNESIESTLVDWLVGEDADGNIVACVSLLRYSPALAEVRSLAVADKVKGQGYGRTIVKALVAEARLRQVPILFALTRVAPFFHKLGFQNSNKERFPEKVWRDCKECPLYHDCDETAVVLPLSPVQPARSIPIPLKQRVPAFSSGPYQTFDE